MVKAFFKINASSNFIQKYEQLCWKFAKKTRMVKIVTVAVDGVKVTAGTDREPWTPKQDKDGRLRIALETQLDLASVAMDSVTKEKEIPYRIYSLGGLNMVNLALKIS